MTDSEIVKALECCIDVNGANCHQCPYDECCSYPESVMLKDTLDLISRLQAENEKLKKVKYIFSTVDYCADDLDKALKENEELKSAINSFRGYENEIKASAYKEFAKFCIDKSKNGIVNVCEIPDYVKELLGDDNDSE